MCSPTGVKSAAAPTRIQPKGDAVEATQRAATDGRMRKKGLHLEGCDNAAGVHSAGVWMDGEDS